MHLILTTYDDDRPILVNWANVCSVESLSGNGEALRARLHFTVTAGTGALSVDVVEDVDDLAELLQAGGETVAEMEDEAEDGTAC